MMMPFRSNESWWHIEMKWPKAPICLAFCSSMGLCSTNREQIFHLSKSFLMPNSSDTILRFYHQSCASICHSSRWPTLSMCLCCSLPQSVAEHDVYTSLHFTVTLPLTLCSTGHSLFTLPVTSSACCVLVLLKFHKTHAHACTDVPSFRSDMTPLSEFFYVHHILFELFIHDWCGLVAQW